MVLNQQPAMKAGLHTLKMIPAVADPRSVLNAAMCELRKRGGGGAEMRWRRRGREQERRGQAGTPADAYPANSTF